MGCLRVGGIGEKKKLLAQRKKGSRHNAGRSHFPHFVVDGGGHTRLNQNMRDLSYLYTKMLEKINKDGLFKINVHTFVMRQKFSVLLHQIQTYGNIHFVLALDLGTIPVPYH